MYCVLGSFRKNHFTVVSSWMLREILWFVKVESRLSNNPSWLKLTNEKDAINNTNFGDHCFIRSFASLIRFDSHGNGSEQRSALTQWAWNTKDGNGNQAQQIEMDLGRTMCPWWNTQAACRDRWTHPPFRPQTKCFLTVDLEVRVADSVLIWMRGYVDYFVAPWWCV